MVSQNLHSQKSNNLQKQNPLKHRVSRDFPLVLPECHLSEYSYTPSGSILPISHLFGQSVSVSKVFRHAEACKKILAGFSFINLRAYIRLVYCIQGRLQGHFRHYIQSRNSRTSILSAVPSYRVCRSEDELPSR